MAEEHGVRDADDVVPSSYFTGSRFGRMFRNLPVLEISDLELLLPST